MEMETSFRLSMTLDEIQALCKFLGKFSPATRIEMGLTTLESEMVSAAYDELWSVVCKYEEDN